MVFGGWGGNLFPRKGEEREREGQKEKEPGQQLQTNKGIPTAVPRTLRSGSLGRVCDEPLSRASIMHPQSLTSSHGSFTTSQASLGQG